MASVHDVAGYILSQTGEITTMKLQKLVYYCQAWNLVWDGEPLFDSKIEAWMNGPVVTDLYNRHRGTFRVSSWDHNPNGLRDEQRETIDTVLESYKELSGQQLSELTHRELPWLEARQGLAQTERSNKQVSLDTMQDFYSAYAEDDLTK